MQWLNGFCKVKLTVSYMKNLRKTCFFICFGYKNTLKTRKHKKMWIRNLHIFFTYGIIQKLYFSFLPSRYKWLIARIFICIHETNRINKTYATHKSILYSVPHITICSFCNFSSLKFTEFHHKFFKFLPLFYIRCTNHIIEWKFLSCHRYCIDKNDEFFFLDIIIKILIQVIYSRKILSWIWHI